jgi:serine/threonine protein kinase
VLLYEMVAGRAPFSGQSSSDVLAAILQNEPSPLTRFDPDAPSDLQRIVGKTLRKDPEQRYQVIRIYCSTCRRCARNSPRPRGPWRRYMRQRWHGRRADAD